MTLRGLPHLSLARHPSGPRRRRRSVFAEDARRQRGRPAAMMSRVLRCTNRFHIVCAPSSPWPLLYAPPLVFVSFAGQWSGEGKRNGLGVVRIDLRARARLPRQAARTPHARGAGHCRVASTGGACKFCNESGRGSAGRRPVVQACGGGDSPAPSAFCARRMLPTRWPASRLAESVRMCKSHS